MSKTERIKILNAEGLELDAHLDFPVNRKPLGYAIFAHCFTCHKNLNAVRNISQALNQQGIAVMRFDFTGLGKSKGEFADSNFSTNISDIKNVSDYLIENYEAPVILIGHSLGGTAILFSAEQINSARAVVTIGSPAFPEHVTHLFESKAQEIEDKGQAIVKIGFQDVIIKKQFIDDVKSQNLQETLSRSKKSYLILHSPQDTVVSIDNAAQLYGLLKHPKSFITLDGADHLLSNNDDSFYVGHVISSWSSRYLDIPQKEKLKTNHQVAVRLNKEDHFTSDISAGVHSFLADEPSSVGGFDFGPSPYDLVASGLGACTVMTLHMYARRKKWNLEEVEVHIDHGKSHASDFEDLDSDQGMIDVFHRNIILKGSLDVKQKARLLEIADKCPVHKTLHAGSKVISKLVEED